MPKNRLLLLLNLLGLLALTLSLMLAACGDEVTPTRPSLTNPTTAGGNPTTVSGNPTPTAAATTTPGGPVPSLQKVNTIFSTYKEPAVNGQPAFPRYNLSPDLSNLSNLADFTLNADQKKLLAQNYFVIAPGTWKYFFEAYNAANNPKIPVYISTDSVANVYHLLFDKLLRETEKNYLLANLKTLNQALYEYSLKQYQALKGSALEGAALRNVAFTAVARKLADPKLDLTDLPGNATGPVAAELKLVNEATGAANSPVVGNGFNDDYSQYLPRGHYTKSEDLKNYFRAMMWYGRVTFRVKYEDETQSALLLAQAIQNGQAGNRKAADLWQSIYEPTVFFVGAADDLTYLDYSNAAKAVWGDAATADPKAFSDKGKLATFKVALQALPPPKIYSSTTDSQASRLGFRLMGQRFTLDAYVMQNLVQPEVPDREMPKGLDIFAALGSEQAFKILDQQGETKNPGFAPQMEKLKTEISSFSAENWTQNLYWGWLYKLKSLLGGRGEGYPAYMQNPAWQSKQLINTLGSWTELKHDTILYSKQVAVATGAFLPPKDLPVGFVEPEPAYYARLATLAGMTRQGLEQRRLIAKEDSALLTTLEQTALQLKTLSEKELSSQPLTEDEKRFIKDWGKQLESFAVQSSDSQDGFRNSSAAGNPLQGQDPALVADVATSDRGILEEATGRVNLIYVAVLIDGKVTLTRGAVYSQYEFITKPGQRLTDEAWQKQLNGGQVPPLEDWKKALIAP